MDSYRQCQARYWIVAGFVLAAIGAIINFVRVVSAGVFEPSLVTSGALTVINPLMLIIAVWVWWWLTSLQPADEVQRNALLKAFYGLAAMYFLGTLLWYFIIFPNGTTPLDFMTTALFLQGASFPVSFVGFLLLARHYATGTGVAEPPLPDESEIDVS